MGSIFGHFREKKTMDYKWVILSILGCFKHFEFNIPSDRVSSGLSEYLKIISIGQPEYKYDCLKGIKHVGVV